MATFVRICVFTILITFVLGQNCNSFDSCELLLGGFVLIDGQRGVFYSESWEPNGSTLYLPVNGTLLANIEKYDQISFEQGCFCIGNAAGGFQQKVQGSPHEFV